MADPVADARPAPGVVRTLIETIYLPWVAMSLGTGVLVVALPLYLLEAGASFTATSIVLGAAGFGAFLAGLPSGALVARAGERAILAGALACIAIGIALTAASDDAALLTALQLAVGGATTAMRLAGQTMLTRTVQPLQRGRAMSSMGGIRRFGAFVGPLLGGVLVDAVGFESTFVLSGALTAVGLVPILRSRRRGSPVVGAEASSPTGHHLLRALRRHGRLLARATSGPFLIMTVRRGRSVLLPLVAAALDVSPTGVGVVVAIGTGADLLLFPVAGWLMDRFGRLVAIGPAFTLMAGGLFLLASADSTMGVVAAGTLIGVGNGLSAGSMLTIASDLAPDDAPSQFMAGFATIQDIGQLIGPVLVGVIADGVGLGASSATLGALLLIGLALIVATVGETSRGERSAA